MTTHTVTVAREGRWWLIEVPDLSIATQAKRVGDIEHAARDLIAVTLDVPISAVEVDIHIGQVGDVRDVSDLAARIRLSRSDIAKLERQLADDAASFARSMADAGVPLRDIAELIGVSFQRVGQLVNQ